MPTRCTTSLISSTTLQNIPHDKSVLHSSMASFDGALVGLGNPLLDVSAVVDQAFLDKYDVRSALLSQVTTQDEGDCQCSNIHRSDHQLAFRCACS
jgi:hypothetical protein